MSLHLCSPSCCDLEDFHSQIARDPVLFATFGKSWYSGSFESYSAFPAKMLVSSEFSGVSSAAMAVYADFFSKLQTFLGAEVTSNFSIPEQWNETSGVGVPLTTWLNTVRDDPSISTLAWGVYLVS